MHKDPYENVYCVIRGEKEVNWWSCKGHWPYFPDNSSTTFRPSLDSIQRLFPCCVQVGLDVWNCSCLWQKQASWWCMMNLANGHVKHFVSSYQLWVLTRSIFDLHMILPIYFLREEAEARSWKTEPLEGPKVPWIAIDPLNPDLETWPSYRHQNDFMRIYSGFLAFIKQW